MKVVAFNGSPRPNGNTHLMIKTVLNELVDSGVDTEIVPFALRPLRGCTACYKCFETKDRRCVLDDDEVNEYVAKMEQADAIILASPTYFADVTAETKAFIDRCGFVARANHGLFKHKIAVPLVSLRRSGGIHALDTILHFFLSQEMVICPGKRWPLAFGGGIGEVERDTEGIENLRVLGANLLWLLNRLR